MLLFDNVPHVVSVRDGRGAVGHFRFLPCQHSPCLQRLLCLNARGVRFSFGLSSRLGPFQREPLLGEPKVIRLWRLSKSPTSAAEPREDQSAAPEKRLACAGRRLARPDTQNASAVRPASLRGRAKRCHGLRRERDCPQNNCVVEAISWFSCVLASRDAPLAENSLR